MSPTFTRKEWMKVLSLSQYDELYSHWYVLLLNPTYKKIRPPEVTLVQLQGKMGATGDSFYIGDATMTRAVILLDDKYYGYAYTLGRHKAKAELCALIDAVLQDAKYHQFVIDKLICPLARLISDKKALKNAEVETTKVDFFTLVRGED